MAKICGIIGQSCQKDELDRLASPMARLRNFRKEYLSGKCFGVCRLFLENETAEIAEDKDLAVIFSGYLLDLPKKENYAKKLIELFSKKKTSFIKELNGVFNIAIYDKITQTSYLINDRYGVNCLYYSCSQSKLVFASEVKSVIQDKNVPREIDWGAWRDYFSFRYILGDKTFFRDVKSLPGASILTYRQGELKIEKYWNYSTIKIDKEQNIDFLIKKGAKLIKKAVQKSAVGVINPICFLSGGYDSRCLAASLTDYTDIKYSTYTTEHPTGAADPLLARKVAKKLKVKNVFVKHPESLYKNCFVEKIYLMDGMASEGIWALPLSHYLKRTFTIFDGMAGDLFLKGLFLDNSNYKYINNERKLASIIFDQCGYSTFFIKKFFKREIRKKIDGGKDSLVEELNKIPYHENKISIFFAKNRTRNALSLLPNNILANQNKRYPFLENDLVDYALGILPELKVKEHLYLKILKRSFPEEMKIPSTNDGTRFKKAGKIFGDILVRLRLQSSLKTFLKNIYFRKYFNFKKEDTNYLKSLLLRIKTPDYINMSQVKKYQKSQKFDFAFFSLIEFLVWYNLFCNNNLKLDLSRDKKL